MDALGAGGTAGQIWGLGQEGEVLEDDIDRPDYPFPHDPTRPLLPSLPHPKRLEHMQHTTRNYS